MKRRNAEQSRSMRLFVFNHNVHGKTSINNHSIRVLLTLTVSILTGVKPCLDLFFAAIGLWNRKPENKILTVPSGWSGDGENWYWRYGQYSVWRVSVTSGRPTQEFSVGYFIIKSSVLCTDRFLSFRSSDKASDRLSFVVYQTKSQGTKCFVEVTFRRLCSENLRARLSEHPL